MASLTASAMGLIVYERSVFDSLQLRCALNGLLYIIDHIKESGQSFSSAHPTLAIRCANGFGDEIQVDEERPSTTLVAATRVFQLCRLK